MYSQNARPRGPPEGIVVHLFQACIFLQLPVGKDRALSGFFSSYVNSQSCAHARSGQPMYVVLGGGGEKEGLWVKCKNGILVFGTTVKSWVFDSALSLQFPPLSGEPFVLPLKALPLLPWSCARLLQAAGQGRNAAPAFKAEGCGCSALCTRLAAIVTLQSSVSINSNILKFANLKSSVRSKLPPFIVLIGLFFLQLCISPWASQVALVVKNLAANAGAISDWGSIPGSGRSPGQGHGNPLQYSCLENPMDRGAWWATVHSVTQSQT